MAAAILVFSLTALFIVVASLETSPINGTHLINTICDYRNHLERDLTIVLNHSRMYEIPINKTCTVSDEDIDSVTIKSDNDNIRVIVTCIIQHRYLVSSVGLAFMNVSISISNVQFNSCSTPLFSFDENITAQLNNSFLYFTNHHFGFLVLINCSAMLQNLVFRQLHGFSIIGFNFKSSNLSHLDITSAIVDTSRHSFKSSGSGVLLVFNEVFINNNDHQVILQDCAFHNLVEIITTQDQLTCFSPVYFTGHRKRMVNSAAITVILDNVRDYVIPKIVIQKVDFLYNFGAGSLMFMLLNSTTGQIILTDSYFIGNFACLCWGNAITLYAVNKRSSRTTSVSPLIVEGLHFNGTSYFGIMYNHLLATTILIDYSLFEFKHNCHIHFIHSLFLSNLGSGIGSCLTIYSSSTSRISLVLESVTAMYNHQLDYGRLPIINNGIFLFNNIHRIIINGSHDYPSRFYENQGSVIQTFASNLIIDGKVEFFHNKALYGAAINMQNSLLYIKNGCDVSFINNTASNLGGAIYINWNALLAELPKCAIQFDPLVQRMIFANNNAGLSGDDIYGYPIFDCYIPNKSTVQIISNVSFYTSQLMNSTSSYSSISTRALNFLKCDHPHNARFFAGETVSIRIAAYDQTNRSVFSLVILYLHGQGKTLINPFNVLESEKVQSVYQTENGMCSFINVTINVPRNYTYSDCLLYLTPPNSIHWTKLTLYYEGCPPGFKKANEVCECSDVIVRFYEDFNYPIGRCDIKTSTISIPPEVSPWIGTTTPDHDEFSISTYCPLMYCNPIDNLMNFKFNRTSQKYVLSSIADVVTDICRPHRTGLMCSSCQQNYNIVFGSDDCKRCSDGKYFQWIILVLIFIVSGPIVLLVIYGLKLTLTTGTINGSCFFFQVSNAGLIQSMILLPRNNQHNLFFTLLSFFNLNFTYPVDCFPFQMNELLKRGLSLLFPLYLLWLVGCIIVLCRYSLWFSRKFSPYSTQILITVVHLSVSRLLLVVIDVVIPVKVYTKNETFYVWDHDGSVRYFSTNHGVLFCVTVLAVACILIPYLVILLFGNQCIRKCPKCSFHVRPVLEAVYAPYKPKYRYWFVLQLLFVILLYVIYGQSKIMGNSYNASLLTTALLSLMLFVQAFIHPLKSKLQNFIDVNFILSATLCYFVLFVFHFQRKKVSNGFMGLLFIISLYLAFFWVFSIILYHLLKVTGFLSNLLDVSSKGLMFIKMFFLQKAKKSAIVNRLMSHCCHDNNAKDHASHHCLNAEFREPLIGDLEDYRTTA